MAAKLDILLQRQAGQYSVTLFVYKAHICREFQVSSIICILPNLIFFPVLNHFKPGCSFLCFCNLFLFVFFLAPLPYSCWKSCGKQATGCLHTDRPRVEETNEISKRLPANGNLSTSSNPLKLQEFLKKIPLRDAGKRKEV